jgi:hypothetical protein
MILTRSINQEVRKNPILSVVAVLVLIESLAVAITLRPIQDDYLNLQSVQQMGIHSYLIDVWQHHGGNLFQFFAHCIFILPTTKAFVFWNFSLFFLLTEILVIVTIFNLMSWVLGKTGLYKSFQNWWLPILTIAGFEGLFVPGFLGTFGYSLASLAHLWPICALLLGLSICYRAKRLWPVSLFLGIVAGNSNLGESTVSLIILAFIWYGIKFNHAIRDTIGIRASLDLSLLSLGTFVGTIIIAAAPGFWLRANDQVGMPNSITSLLERFVKSFVSFSADAVTHPMVWLVLLLGVFLAARREIDLSTETKARISLLAYGAVAIWFVLILGSTIAYPAWHQSMGMYLFLIPAMYFLGFKHSSKIIIYLKWRFLVNLLIVISLIMSIAFLRIGYLSLERSSNWDKNLKENICALKINIDSPLKGAEIRYPPFKLGVEDVNTWDWMRQKYSGWVLSISKSTRTSC